MNTILWYRNVCKETWQMCYFLMSHVYKILKRRSLRNNNFHFYPLLVQSCNVNEEFLINTGTNMSDGYLLTFICLPRLLTEAIVNKMLSFIARTRKELPEKIESSWEIDHEINFGGNKRTAGEWGRGGVCYWGDY